MAGLKEVRAWKLTQAAEARRLGITQPRPNDLPRGKIDKFNLDMLIDLARKAGVKVRMQIAMHPNAA